MSAEDKLHALIAEVVEHELATAVIAHLKANMDYEGFMLHGREIHKIIETDWRDNNGETVTWEVYTEPKEEEDE